MIHNFSKDRSIIQTFIAELRDSSIQKDSMRFRRNLERISEILAYELSKELKYKKVNVTTPLGIANMELVEEQPILATILRAGLGMHSGLLNYFDRADSAFISAYRKHSSKESFDIHVEYLASPNIDDKTLIISDPMLATGNSMAMVYKSLLSQGKPSKLIIVSAIATPKALKFLEKELPKSSTYYIGAIDNKLTAESYIVPGLGDAGDLAYGTKI